MTPQVPGVGPPTPSINIDASPKKAVTQAPRVPTVDEPRVWNTKNLGLRLASDFVAGFSAACIVAPVITIIDK